MTLTAADVPGPRVEHVALHDAADAWFTGRAPRDAPAVGAAGNLSHHRPHVPAVLAADRAAVGRATGTDPTTWHLMTQVHGADVAVVDAATPPGAELRGVDVLVTGEQGRVLAVGTADCVPLLLASTEAVAAAHVGRGGLAAGAVAAALEALPGDDVRAVVGPSIGGCCYEVPASMRDEVVAASHDAAAAETTWGTPSLDIPAAVVALLAERGVRVDRVGGCTRCSDGWFSHRADPTTGRQLGLVVRR